MADYFFRSHGVCSFHCCVEFAKNYSKKIVESQFVGKKVDVLEQNIEAYNDLFFNRIPEVSFYQGYLDSAVASVYSDSILRKYEFVNTILFFDVNVHSDEDGLAVSAKKIFRFTHTDKKGEKVYDAHLKERLDITIAEDFEAMVAKMVRFVEIADTTRSINNDEINRFFYAVVPEKITYMNIPRKEDIKIYKHFVEGKVVNLSGYDQDIFTFYIDPRLLKLKNIHPELYEKIEIKPLFYTSLDTDPDLLTTESPLPGALASYKLYFSSTRHFLEREVDRHFLPLAGVISLCYLVLFIIGYLIYRNISFNTKMFKLQYDFVNNLTHEFKTPVSVIKIAGNNMRSAKELKDDTRMLYGKILDEEADKLNNLLNTLLSFTQIENRSIEVKKEHVNLLEFCAKIVDSYTIKYPDFSLNYELQDVDSMDTDPVLLGSIFQNLIDNAYKYSEEGKKWLKIIIYKQKKQIMFKFVDKGIGIPKGELANIFKKFYRIKSQYNQQGSVGLGLAFCKELLNFMGGDVEVISAEGEGSTFTVILPHIQ